MAHHGEMQTAYDRLIETSQRLKTARRPGWGEEASHLDVKLAGDGILVDWLLNEDAFQPDDEDDNIFAEIISVIASPQIAPWLKSLTLEGHQIACNGTIEWEIGPIVSAEAPFSRLKVFSLASVEHKGAPCFAGTLNCDGSEEVDIASRLLARMPALEELTLPEPPQDEEFFRGASHPLKKLSVFDVDINSFVLDLATCKKFPELKEIHLRESCRTDVNPRLPPGHYLKLFQSDAFPALSVVTLAQVDLTDKHVKALQKTPVGRRLSKLTVKPAEPWCKRPILHATPDDV